MMRKIITTFSEIEDVFNINMEILKGKESRINDGCIELENGVMIRSLRDGRYIDESEDQWEALLLQEYDNDGEPYRSELIGYIKIS